MTLRFRYRQIFGFIVGALIGAVIGYFWPEYGPRLNQPLNPYIGAFEGGLIGLAIGLFWDHRYRRALAAAWIAFALPFAFHAGGPLTAMFALSTIALTFVVSATVIRELYGGDEWDAIHHHFQMMTTNQGGFHVIEDGKTTVPSGDGPHFGPKLVIVKPGNAVVMERGYSFSRICGPCVFQSERFEYVKHYVQLLPQRQAMVFYDVLASDLVPLTITLSVDYAVDVSPETVSGTRGNERLENGSQGLTQDEYDTIFRNVIVWPHWKEELRNAVGSSLRDFIAELESDRLIGVIGYAGIATLVEESVSFIGSDWGIRIQSLRITDIELPENLVAARTALAVARVDAQTLIERESAAGAAWSQKLDRIADGYELARHNKRMSDEQIRVETNRHMMETMSDGIANKIVLSPEARHLQAGINDDAAIDGILDPKAPPPTDDAA